MKKYNLILIVLVFALFLGACTTNNQKVTNIDVSSQEDTYLGLKPPGKIAEIFSPEIFSQDGWELKGLFRQDMEEFYFTNTQDAPFVPNVVVFRKEDRIWKKYDFYATDSGDSMILYSKNKYIERIDSGWSEIKSIGSMFEREDWGIMRLSGSAKGTYVFDDYKSNDVLRISKITAGKREEPTLLGEEFNTGKWTAHPFIAADESYILWDSEREGGYGNSDMYISFRELDGSWSTAINMGGNINTHIDENTARITTDGKYLFFWRADEKLREDGSKYWISTRHWVDAQVIEDLRIKYQEQQ